jgi:integrase
MCKELVGNWLTSVLSFLPEGEQLTTNRMNQMPTDPQPIDPQKSAPKNVPRGTKALSKAHLAYWEHAIFQRRAGGNWWMLLQHAGERRKLSLGTPIKAAAVAKARDLYLSIIHVGWEVALAELHGPPAASQTRTQVTVGQFLEELKAKADLKPETLKGYAIAFRAIIEDIFGIEGGKEKFDYRGGGHARWLERVHAVRLADVTPSKVQEWKRAFIARAGNDPVKQRSARTSFNSFLRRAKSLFGPKCSKHLSVTLPSPLPFEGVAFEPRQSARYRSNIDPAKLTQAAMTELAEQDPPVFLAFLLALGAGLRRIEIDRLEWSAFQWNHNAIRIEPTRYFDVKSEHSKGDVQIDPELISLFRGYAALARSSFVIEVGGGADLPGVRSFADHYRVKAVFERLSAWLKAHGVTARKPIHELRKEFGSMVNREHGLSAASDQLRHADIGITAACYIDRPRKATSGLGPLLTGKVLEFKQDHEPPDGFPGLRFKFAKTMPDSPHFYVVWSAKNTAEYEALSERIAKEGVLESWRDGKQYRYWYDPAGQWKYWEIHPVINRARVNLKAEQL